MLAEVEANTQLLRLRQKELEEQLLAMPATSWLEATTKARYLLAHYKNSLGLQDTQHRLLIDAVLADFARLLGEV